MNRSILVGAFALMNGQASSSAYWRNSAIRTRADYSPIRSTMSQRPDRAVRAKLPLTTSMGGLIPGEHYTSLMWPSRKREGGLRRIGGVERNRYVQSGMFSYVTTQQYDVILFRDSILCLARKDQSDAGPILEVSEGKWRLHRAEVGREWQIQNN